MSTLIFIGLLGVFAYHCGAIYKGFRGSSKAVKELIGLAGNIGYLVYYGVLIWSFWYYEWWQPIVTFVVAIIVGGLSAILFQKNIIGMMISPVLVVVFSILSIIGLLAN